MSIDANADITPLTVYILDGLNFYGKTLAQLDSSNSNSLNFGERLACEEDRSWQSGYELATENKNETVKKKEEEVT